MLVRPANPGNGAGRLAALWKKPPSSRSRGEIDAIVTGPIHKARMYEIGFKFPGQTEFFADRCGVSNFAMLLTGGKLTVALVTTHIPLREVPDALQAKRSSASACFSRIFFASAA